MGYTHQDGKDWYDEIHYPWIFVGFDGVFHCFNSAEEARDHARWVKEYNASPWWKKLYKDLFDPWKPPRKK